MAWTSPLKEFNPFVPVKLSNTVKVCAVATVVAIAINMTVVNMSAALARNDFNFILSSCHVTVACLDLFASRGDGFVFAVAYGLTRKILLLVSVPLGVVTVTKPVVAPSGTETVR